jgi:hypothetical protein
MHAKCQSAFDTVKQPVLEDVYSGGVDDRQYYLYTDASKTGLGEKVLLIQDVRT